MFSGRCTCKEWFLRETKSSLETGQSQNGELQRAHGEQATGGQTDWWGRVCGEFKMCVCVWETKRVYNNQKTEEVSWTKTLACLLYPCTHAAAFNWHKQTGSYMLNECLCSRCDFTVILFQTPPLPIREWHFRDLFFSVCVSVWQHEKLRSLIDQSLRTHSNQCSLIVFMFLIIS